MSENQVSKSVFENMAKAGDYVLDLLNHGWNVEDVKAELIRRGVDPAELESARVREVFRTSVLFFELGY